MSDHNNIDAAGGSVAIPRTTLDASTPTLRWYTAAELGTRACTEPDWLVKPLIALGSITELSARVKLGKTRLTMDAIAAMLAGTEFLGQPTRKAGVVYLTEEGEQTFRQALARGGLLDRVELHVLLRHEARTVSWPDIIALAVQKCRETGSALIVIDTLPDWAGLRGEDENNSGRALEAMQPLRDASAQNLAILVLRHDRKSGGGVGDSGRGSSAFAGAADILLSLKPTDGKQQTTRRRLEGIGRFDGLPGVQILDLKDGHYVALGEGGDAVAAMTRERILAALQDASEVLTTKQLGEALGSEVSESTVRRAIEELHDEDAVFKVTGLGATKRAFGWRVAQ